MTIKRILVAIAAVVMMTVSANALSMKQFLKNMSSMPNVKVLEKEQVAEMHLAQYLSLSIKEAKSYFVENADETAKRTVKNNVGIISDGSYTKIIDNEVGDSYIAVFIDDKMKKASRKLVIINIDSSGIMVIDVKGVMNIPAK